MSTWEEKFLIAVRFVFVFAYGAFLWASIHHVAAYFNSFEPAGTGEAGGYALAIAVDGTALILAIGMMFFSRNMPWYAKLIVWLFIIALTGFSWLVNWQYAVINQSDTIASKLDPMWRNLNPILASSFAFLNLAYSIVAEFFNTKQKTAAELQDELNELNSTADLKKKIRDKRAELKGPSIIEQAKKTVMEVKDAATEVIKKEEKLVQNNTVIDPQKSPETAQKNTLLSLPEPAEDKLALTLQTLEKNTQITDEVLAEILNLKRPASARFWRLKAIDILRNNISTSTQILAQNEEQDFDQIAPTSDEKSDQDQPEIDTEDLPEFDETQPTTDPEIETVELPSDDEEVDQPKAQNNVTPQRQDSPKKELKGMLYRQAAKLPICQQKKITAADIRSAISHKELRTYSDGSVSKSAIENWARTFTKTDSPEREKVSA